MLLGGRYLERANTSRELFKFLFILSVVPNFVIFLGLMLAYMVTGRESILNTPIYGSTALQVGILVSFKVTKRNNVKFVRLLMSC